MKIQTNLLLIVIDHKQKVLQMQHREGQVEYYGKKGMSVLGSMMTSWMINEKGVGGYQYQFKDYILKGYTGQDNLQVAAVIEKILNHVKLECPHIDQVIFQSDNATCSALQELIPFIYHRN